MICGVKFRISCARLCESLKVNPYLEFHATVKSNTGEVLKLEALYNDLTFTIYPNNSLIVRGSLHKYFKRDNFSDFTFSEIQACLKELQVKFGIDPETARVHNLEFGVNITTHFSPLDFCKNLIAHKSNPFIEMRAYRNNSNIGFECQSSQYRVKVYDKGKQCYIKHKHILRFEIKVQRMQFIKPQFVRTLSDLANEHSLNELKRILLANFALIIVNDNTVLESKLTAHEQRIYLTFKNPRSWEQLNHRQRYRRKKQFEAIIAKHGKVNHKGFIEQQISQKWQQLITH